MEMRDYLAQLRLPDPRAPREIEDEIEEELQTHIELRVRDLVAEGLDEAAARARAGELFGDLASIRRECRRIQMGERVMWQRVQTILILVLASAVGLTSW